MNLNSYTMTYIYFYPSGFNKFKLTTLMFILSLNVLLAQNLFQNSSFESTSDQSKPREDSELEYATPWQDDKNIIRRGLLGSICRTIHSPDYFKCNGTMKLSDILYYQNNPNLAGG